MSELREYGIQLINFSSLSDEDAAFLEKYLKKEIRPLLAPQIISKRQPFPFLRGKEIYAVVADELILHFMPKIFKGHDIAGKSLVRIILPGRILQKSVQQNALIKKPFSFNLSYIH